MRKFLSQLKKLREAWKLSIETLQRVPSLKQPFLAMWLIWMVGVFILFDGIFAEVFWNMGEKFALFLIAGMFSSIRSFHSKRFVNLELKRKINNLTGYLYCSNLTWMAIGIGVEVFTLSAQMSIVALIVRDSAFLLFWFLTIPSAVIYSPWKWILYAANIFVGTFVYRWILDAYVDVHDEVSIQFVCMTVGVVLITATLSVAFSHHKIQKMFGSEA